MSRRTIPRRKLRSARLTDHGRSAMQMQTGIDRRRVVGVGDDESRAGKGPRPIRSFPRCCHTLPAEVVL